MNTIPSETELEMMTSSKRHGVHPSWVPWIVTHHLPQYYVEQILAAKSDDHQFPRCGAVTSEVPLEALGEVIDILLDANDQYFHYNLDFFEGWVQTYRSGGHYPLHMDGIPGETRKLTALVMLSHESEYNGGDLIFRIPPRDIIARKVRGIVYIYPHWVLHEVSLVTYGLRQTLNLGAWGPEFR